MSNMETFEDYVEWREALCISKHEFALVWLENFLQDNVKHYEREMDHFNGNYRSYLTGRLEMSIAALQQIKRAKLA